MCLDNGQLSENESRRSQSRKQWLQQITHVAEAGATAIEPLYQAVFASLRQVAVLVASFIMSLAVWLSSRGVATRGISVYIPPNQAK